MVAQRGWCNRDAHHEGRTLIKHTRHLNRSAVQINELMHNPQAAPTAILVGCATPMNLTEFLKKRCGSASAEMPRPGSLFVVGFADRSRPNRTANQTSEHNHRDEVRQQLQELGWDWDIEYLDIQNLKPDPESLRKTKE